MSPTIDAPEPDPTTRELNPWSNSTAEALTEIVVLAKTSSLQRWVTDELAGESYRVRMTTSADQLLANMRGHDPAVAIIDFGAMNQDELEHLRTFRAGWLGTFISLAPITTELRDALRVRFVLMSRLGSEWLRKTVGEAVTTRVKKRKQPKRS